MGYAVSVTVNPRLFTPVLQKHGTTKASARAAIIDALGLDPNEFMAPTPRSMRCQPTSLLIPMKLKKFLIATAEKKRISTSALAVQILNSWLDRGALFFDGQTSGNRGISDANSSVCLYLPHDLLDRLNEVKRDRGITLASIIRKTLKSELVQP